MIVGIAGTIGSGKGTVVSYLKTKGFIHYSSSETLRSILHEQGLPETREYLSPLAKKLSEEREGGVVALSYERAKKEGYQHIVLEALHRRAEEDFVRKIGGKIIGIDASIDTRYERIHKRQEGEKDNVSFEQFKKDAENEDAGKGGTSHILDIISRADVVITNNGTVEQLYTQIDEVLKKLM